MDLVIFIIAVTIDCCAEVIRNVSKLVYLVPLLINYSFHINQIPFRTDPEDIIFVSVNFHQFCGSKVSQILRFLDVSLSEVIHRVYNPQY